MREGRDFFRDWLTKWRVHQDDSGIFARSVCLSVRHVVRTYSLLPYYLLCFLPILLLLQVLARSTKLSKDFWDEELEIFLPLLRSDLQRLFLSDQVRGRAGYSKLFFPRSRARSVWVPLRFKSHFTHQELAQCVRPGIYIWHMHARGGWGVYSFV